MRAETETAANSSVRQPHEAMRRALFRRPCFVVGMPVNRANLRLAFVTPKARFAEKVTPGMRNFLLLRLAI